MYIMSVFIFLCAMGSSVATIILIMFQFPMWMSLYFLFSAGISWLCFYKFMEVFNNEG